MGKKLQLSQEEIQSLKNQLPRLLKGMDLPDYRKSDIRWLQRNIQVRNLEHKNFKDAFDTISKLHSIGIVKI